MALAGANGKGVVTGNAMATDNTGRDAGQAIGLGAATAGAVIGSILTWGAATPALAALDAAAIGGTIAKDKIEDDADAKVQQRQLQGSLDANMKARQPTTGTGAFTKAGAQAQPGAAVSPIAVKPGVAPTPMTPAQTPTAMTEDQGTTFTGGPGGVTASTPGTDYQYNKGGMMTQASDRRAKTKIISGDNAAQVFLDIVRRSGTWPAGIKDPKAAS